FRTERTHGPPCPASRPRTAGTGGAAAAAGVRAGGGAVPGRRRAWRPPPRGVRGAGAEERRSRSAASLRLDRSDAQTVPLMAPRGRHILEIGGRPVSRDRPAFPRTASDTQGVWIPRWWEGGV